MNTDLELKTKSNDASWGEQQLKRSENAMEGKIISLLMGIVQNTHIANKNLDITQRKVKVLDQFIFSKKNQNQAFESEKNRVYFCALVSINNLLKSRLIENNREIGESQCTIDPKLFEKVTINPCRQKILDYFTKLISIEQRQLQSNENELISEKKWMKIQNYIEENSQNKDLKTKLDCLKYFQDSLLPYIEMKPSEMEAARSDSKGLVVQQKTNPLSLGKIEMRALLTRYAGPLLALAMVCLWVMSKYLYKEESRVN